MMKRGERMEGTIGVATKGIVVCDEKVLLVKRSAQAHYKPETWEFPGGKLEFGEAPRDGLRREIREETGLDVLVDALLYEASFFTSDTRQVVLLTYGCSVEADSVALSDEHCAYRWVTRREMEALLEPDILRDLRAGIELEHLPIHP